MTDITIKPEVIWIEGRCYRVNDPTTEITALQEHDLYENETPINDLDDCDDDDDIEVIKMTNSRFCTNLHVSKHYMGYVIGKKGAVKYRIERDTKTEIKIPKQGQTGDIVILGASESNVKAARRRINIIVMSSRMKQKSTHFLSIPMNQANIIENFERFKERVLKECLNFDESLFIRAHKLHLTLGVMCLMDNEERLLASKLLTEAKDKVIVQQKKTRLFEKRRTDKYELIFEELVGNGGCVMSFDKNILLSLANIPTPILKSHGPLKIRLKGLSYMNDDPRQIDVLYGLVHEEGQTTGVLQNLGDSLVEHFYKAGFMDREYGRDKIKLHVTLINSKYRNKSSTTIENSPAHSRKPRESFDGSGILRNFSDYDFGVMELTEIHLSQRHSMASNGYYQPTYIINIQ